jgi:hypothetical protein
MAINLIHIMNQLFCNLETITYWSNIQPYALMVKVIWYLASSCIQFMRKKLTSSYSVDTWSRQAANKNWIFSSAISHIPHHGEANTYISFCCSRYSLLCPFPLVLLAHQHNNMTWSNITSKINTHNRWWARSPGPSVISTAEFWRKNQSPLQCAARKYNYTANMF